MVDKNLFLYDLAVVSILKNEAPYIKEWLDYHIVAGVDHFYLYDNDSSDNLTEVLQPYIDAEIVTYTFYPGKCRQMEAYIDAVKRFRFFCRYMAWIDADEFIFPKSKATITEVVDEIISNNLVNISGLAVNIHTFGSNNFKTADYDVGVLERFTRRAGNDWTPPLKDIPPFLGGSALVSTIANPRKVKVFYTPHAPEYFINCFAVNEKGDFAPNFSSFPVSTEKIVMNHYSVKSKEEYTKKLTRGNADHAVSNYTMDKFYEYDRNEVLDDGILRYYDKRIDILFADDKYATLVSSKQVDYTILLNALDTTLIPTMLNRLPQEFFNDKVETFLTCLNLSAYLKKKFIDNNGSKILEEMSLNALYKSLNANLQPSDVELLLKEMPKILSMPYPVVKEIRAVLKEIIPQIMAMFRMNNDWLHFIDWEHELDMLKSFNEVMKN